MPMSAIKSSSRCPFYFYSIDEDNYNHIGYTFNVQDGKVVQDEDD